MSSLIGRGLALVLACVVGALVGAETAGARARGRRCSPADSLGSVKLMNLLFFLATAGVVGAVAGDLVLPRCTWTGALVVVLDGAELLLARLVGGLVVVVVVLVLVVLVVDFCLIIASRSSLRVRLVAGAPRRSVAAPREDSKLATGSNGRRLLEVVEAGRAVVVVLDVLGMLVVLVVLDVLVVLVVLVVGAPVWGAVGS